ncbi:MAG TPA: APC family permease [Polyangiaceae bacterium]
MASKLSRWVFGAPKDVHDEHVFHKLSLVAMLAWVGLGADGLSSSAYGPDEAFRALVKGGEAHASLAVGLAIGTALTVFVISYAYSRIIEAFPSGGGGYLVATKMLGPKFGLVSGSALLVDYVLTITISIAAGGDALFSLIPRAWLGGEGTAVADMGTWLDPVQRTKVVVELGAITLLTILNVRGVKESVTAILPLFLVFVLTHVVLLAFAIGGRASEAGAVLHETSLNYRSTVTSLGAFGTLALFVRAYSLGGGTYTGIEAVSNGIQIMREPKVRTAKRTMVLMATSLSLTAGGIILAYLLAHVMPVEGQTMNAVLLEKVAGGWTLGTLPVGKWFILVALVSEAGLLFIAAQAGFLDGPRVMANMAIDSWLPHRFAALSERLSMRNGVLLMGGTSLAALIYTHGDVSKLVVMYSINVFLTFSLSNLAMSKHWIGERKSDPQWLRHLPIHLIGLFLCLTILVITCVEKFGEGGWLTLVLTGALVALCTYVKSHYTAVGGAIRRLDVDLPDPLVNRARTSDASWSLAPIDAEKPVAILFVGGYGGLGRHALFTLLRMFPNHFRGVVFCSVAIVDSGNFKGAAEVAQLETRTRQELAKYIDFAVTLGLPADSAFATGIEVAVEAAKLGAELVAKYPHALFVAGQLVFEEDTSAHRALHNETAFTIQRRLQRIGVPMIVLPVQIDLKEGKVGGLAPVPGVPSVSI